MDEKNWRDEFMVVEVREDAYICTSERMDGSKKGVLKIVEV